MFLIKRKACLILAVISFLFLAQTSSRAHFGMVIPSTDIVETKKESKVNIKVMFAHPFDGVSMNMSKPAQFGVMVNGEKEDLLKDLNSYNLKMYSDEQFFQAWEANYAIKRPGDYLFYVEPAPYWEPAEDVYIIHYTKVIVSAFGKEEGWDTEVGLKTEIIPLTRPYGLYTGNIFQGIVKVNGQPVPFSEVEIEHYNETDTYTAPKAAFVTQVVKCDPNGVFTYAIPEAGWWGFAALNKDGKTMKHGEDEKSIEIGAVLWIKAYAIKHNYDKLKRNLLPIKQMIGSY